ncbi:MAG TPA: malto-oligosyltrehalose trehalohydrolase [Chthoniobacterales bacterium]
MMGIITFATKRRYPIGAELIAPDETHFRVWAPKAHRLDVAIEVSAEKNARRHFYPLEPEPGGYFSGHAPAAAGALYRFRVDGDEHLHPDPASRSQPEGPHRSSAVVDPFAFPWIDSAWRGLSLKDQVLYEMHIGTFTPEGTWAAAARQLPELARTGISLIEMMPIADFPGEFGWGYDGVNLFAPCRLYGTPDDLRRFLAHAHSLGIGVILDVVYNHLGPEGNYLTVFSDYYFTKQHETEWGEPINFDGESSLPVREFFLTNARYWIDEFHFDGFRFDATQSIFDESEKHILQALGEAARGAAGDREIVLIAENEPQNTRLLRPTTEAGYGFDGVWNDDFHHSAQVALNGRREAYYTDYGGTPQEFISAAKYGYLYQGQYYRWQKKRRGTPGFGLPPEAFISFIDNHDQVANSLRSERTRLTTSPGRYRAMSALLLLGPWTPLLFQGQEFGATTPFRYFADVTPDLHEAIRGGRAEFLAQFPSIANDAAQSQLADPLERATFQQSKLDFSEREKFPMIWAMYCDLIHLRRDDPCFSKQQANRVDGAVLSAHAFLLRYFDSLGNDRLIIVNFGNALRLEIAPEPLLAPPVGQGWSTLWSSEAPRYGGPGETEIETTHGWQLPAEATVAFRATPLPDAVR